MAYRRSVYDMDDHRAEGGTCTDRGRRSSHSPTSNVHAPKLGAVRIIVALDHDVVGVTVPNRCNQKAFRMTTVQRKTSSHAYAPPRIHTHTLTHANPLTDLGHVKDSVHTAFGWRPNRVFPFCLMINTAVGATRQGFSTIALSR